MPSAQRSLWQATAVPLTDIPALGRDTCTEVAIIGAGYAGLSTGLALARRGTDCVVIEAEEPGSGASGRSGGQVLAGLSHDPAALTRVYGAETGKRLFEFGATTADRVFNIISEEGLECDAKRDGSIWAADTDAGIIQSQERVDVWKEHGVRAEFLDKAAIGEVLNTDLYRGGFFDPRGGTVQPLSLVRELARAAMKHGARVFCDTPALSMRRDGDHWQIETPRAKLRARRVLVATAGMSGVFVKDLSKTYLTVWSFQIATRPLIGEEIGPRTGAAVSDTRRVLSYFTKNREGRLLIGGKGLLKGPKGPESYAFQRHQLARLYPDLADEEPEFYWGGRVAISLPRLPAYYEVGQDAYAAVACNGRGVAWNVAMGPVLADLLTGADPNFLPLPPLKSPRPIPFHGMRALYKTAGNAWLRFRDRMER